MPRKTRKTRRKIKKKNKQTRVRRCVYKLKKKHKIGAAIAICQYSTRQGYKTGRKLRRKRKSQNVPWRV